MSCILLGGSQAPPLWHFLGYVLLEMPLCKLVVQEFGLQVIEEKYEDNVDVNNCLNLMKSTDERKKFLALLRLEEIVGEEPSVLFAKCLFANEILAYDIMLESSERLLETNPEVCAQ